MEQVANFKSVTARGMYVIYSEKQSSALVSPPPTFIMLWCAGVYYEQGFFSRCLIIVTTTMIIIIDNILHIHSSSVRVNSKTKNPLRLYFQQTPSKSRLQKCMREISSIQDGLQTQLNEYKQQKKRSLYLLYLFKVEEICI